MPLSPHQSPAPAAVALAAMLCAAGLAPALHAQPAGSPPLGTPPAAGVSADLPADPEMLLARLSSAASLDEAITIRGRLIQVAADDTRAPTWMVEQAAAMLDRLRRDGSDASALFGIPTPQQAAAVESAADEAFKLIARAEELAGRVVSRLQQSLIDPGGDPIAVRAAAERADRDLTRLIDVELGVRIPFFRGRAAVLLAAVEKQRPAKDEFIRVALASMGKLPLATAAAESSRRVALGAALVMLAQGNETPLSQARELLRWVTEHPPAHTAGDAPDAVTRAEAWMGIIRAARTPGDLRTAREALALASLTEPFMAAGSDGKPRPDPLLSLLTAEAAAKAILVMPRAPGARVQHLNEGFAPLIDLLRRDDLREHRAALRPLVLGKIGAATDPLMPLESLDPAVPFARALALAQSSAPGEARRDQAMALLTAVAARSDAGAIAADALWEIAVLLWETGRPADGAGAVEALCRLAEEFHDSPRAPEAATKAVELARYTLASLAKESAPDRNVQERLSTLYARALELAVKLSPQSPEAAEKRLERARIALENSAPASNGPAAPAPGSTPLAPVETEILTPEQLEAALNALEGIPASDPRRAEADRLAQAAVDRAIAAATDAVARAVAADGPGSILAGPARERLIAIARRSVQWAQQRKPADLDRYRLVLADALLDAGDARAAAVYEDIVARAGASSDMALRARLGLGRAQRTARQSEQAFSTLRALTDDLERSAAAQKPPSPRRHPTYWLAWAEMLEILGADNRDGRRTDMIRLQINRLALVDPEFGGGEGKRRIEAVRRSIEGR